MNRARQTVIHQNVGVEETVRAIVADVLDVEESSVRLDCRFREDLGADSLDLVTLIMELSSAFEADVCDSDVLTIQTVGEAIAYLEEHSLSISPSSSAR